jgi:hypothetical protein
VTQDDVGRVVTIWGVVRDDFGFPGNREYELLVASTEFVMFAPSTL